MCFQERFAPMIFISNDEIATYYRGAWSQQRRQRGLSIPPLTEVTEEIRTANPTKRFGKPRRIRRDLRVPVLGASRLHHRPY